MGNTATTMNKLTGKIIGHTVKFMPKRVNYRGAGITITKSEKLSASVTIQVDDKRMYIVPVKGIEMVLENQEPDEETRVLMYNKLMKQHPFNSERAFKEYVTTTDEKSALRRYELEK